MLESRGGRLHLRRKLAFLALGRVYPNAAGQLSNNEADAGAIRPVSPSETPG